MPQATAAPAQTAAQKARSTNHALRQLVLQNSIELEQPIYSGTIAALAAGNATVNVAPRFAGLWKRFIIKISGTANNTGGATATLSDFGLANLLSQVVLTDLNGNTRVQTSGTHLAMLASVKEQFAGVSSALLAGSLSQFGNFGDNFDVIQAAATIAAAGSAPFQMYFELPCSYSDEDLRGAIWGGVVNATANIQLTLNANAFVVAGADSTNAVYYGSAGNLSNLTIEVYQVYLDQVPRDNNGAPLLPPTDLATVYLLNSTAFAGMVAGNDFPLPYANFRDFLSTFVLYNHDGSANAGRVGGGDLNYLALQSANFLNIKKLDPATAAYHTRKMIKADVPPGLYYFSSRKKPISTINFGNMQMILNPITAAAQAYAVAMWEQFALTNVLQNAGSLAG